MNDDAIIQDFVNAIAFNGFTPNQMRTMLCAVVENMDTNQAADLLDTIGMNLADII
jgi:hypothetical protein